MTTGRRRTIAILAYSSIFVLLAIGLSIALPAGNRIEPAPTAAPVGDVAGPGSACLGDRVVTVQSGVFLDLHHSGTGGAGEDDIGERLVGGRIDRLDGTGELAGRCAPDSALDGVDATLTVAVGAGGRITGEVVAAGETAPVIITAVDLSQEPGAHDEDLAGGELLARLLLAVAVVMVAARMLGTLFGRIHQPRVIGEIVAGILLGPSLLGLLAPEVTRYLFPAEVTEVLGILAQFGLVFFMFLIGLELDHKMIRGSGHTAILISHYSIVVPFMLGLGAALVVYPLVGSGNFTGFALFMGAAMAITAFPVLARILTDTGLHKTRIGALAITCAAVDDVTAWCVLAIVVAIVKATGVMDGLQTVALSLLFLTAMFVVVRPLLARLMSTRKRRGPIGAGMMTAMLVGLFLSAWATEAIGIHAIFGAFMFGAILPRSRSITTQITERLEDVTVLFLLPVFFAVVGLSTRIGLVSGRDLWMATGLIIAIAIVGKIGGSIIAGLSAGESLRSSTVIGVLMNARGITEIVILTIGRSLGVISPALFTIMVLMALVTTFMTTPLLSILYPRTHVDEESTSSTGSPPMKVRSTAGNVGPVRVMVGVTDPVNARPLLRLVAGMRQRDESPPDVLLVTVVAPPGHEEVRVNLAGLDESATIAAEGLTLAQEELAGLGLGADLATVVGANPAEELARLVVERDITLLVVGSHEAYLGFRPFGGVAGEILRTIPCHVAMLVGMGTQTQFQDGPIGVWYREDGSDGAALDVAAGIAKGTGRAIRLVSPVPVEAPDLGVEIEVTVVEEPTVDAALGAIAGTSLMVVAPPGTVDGVLPALREAVIERASVPVLVVRDYATSDVATDPAKAH